MGSKRGDTMSRNYYNNNSFRYRSDQSVGTDFEQLVIFVLKQKFKYIKSYKITDHTGTKLDKEQGTDFTCGEIRFDATTNFSEKNNMPWIKDTELEATPFKNFMLGIRNHNNKQPFEQPVVIIGLDVEPREYHLYEDLIEENLKKHAKELINQASECLDDYQAADEKTRQELGIETVLTKNPEYEPPRKGLPPKYEKIEKFRQQLDHLDSITENAPSQDKKEFNYE